MHPLASLKQDFIFQAHQLGFTHVGITPSYPVPHIQTFLDWVKAGHQADMGYLNRADTLAKRADPGLILEGCQCVICLAMPYKPPETPLNETPPGCGRISAYARTRDYHLVIQEKLLELEGLIQDHGGQAKSYVDTGPVLERAFAAQAGIGMPGKNTNLIIPRAGSYHFLAVMLTDLALPADPPFTQDLCGSCQRCIDACPTNCILPDGTIDASRCISYLTIENKGSIPNSLKKQVGDWLFGCDICQMVCPHNAKVPDQPGPLGEAYLPEFMDLQTILSWDEVDFRAATQNTALSRAKLRGLVRNAAVVLGNQGRMDALAGLKIRLENENDPVVQDALQWAIHQITGTAS